MSKTRRNADNADIIDDVESFLDWVEDHVSREGPEHWAAMAEGISIAAADYGDRCGYDAEHGAENWRGWLNDALMRRMGWISEEDWA